MAKRRRAPDAPEKAPEDLTPEERREKRRRERASKDKHRTKSLGSRWRRTAVVGGAGGVIAAVVVVLVFFHPFGVPCLQFQANPSGTPAFPGHDTTDFTGTWCPSGVTVVMQTYPLLTVSINGNVVSLPSSIGRNSSYTLGGNPYECDLPLVTRSAALTGLPANTIEIISPWPYDYNLSDFFQVWAQSYSTVSVNATSPSQPIVYTTTDLLGFTADSGHVVTLYVDNQPSSAGPNLLLNTLDGTPSPYPTCLGEVYGTGHHILLTYGARPQTAALAPGAPGHLETGRYSGYRPAAAAFRWSFLSASGIVVDPSLYVLVGLTWLGLFRSS